MWKSKYCLIQKLVISDSSMSRVKYSCHVITLVDGMVHVSSKELWRIQIEKYQLIKYSKQIIGCMYMYTGKCKEWKVKKQFSAVGMRELTSIGFLLRTTKLSALIIMNLINLWQRIFSISSACLIDILTRIELMEASIRTFSFSFLLMTTGFRSSSRLAL